MNSVIVLDRSNFQLAVAPSWSAVILAALETSALIGTVKDQSTQEGAVIALREIKTVLRSIEDSRAEVKGPVWELGKQIDAKAKQVSSDLVGEATRLTELISAFQREQREQREAIERERLVEVQRIESERLEKISIANQVLQAQEEARQKELRAIELSALVASAAEQAGLQRQRELIERERQLHESEAAIRLRTEANDRIAAQAYLDAMKAAPVVVADGMSVKPSFDFEVTNIHDFYRSHPGNVKMEVRLAETLDLINRLGMRTVPGLRVFEVHKVKVRAASNKQLTAIEV